MNNVDARGGVERDGIERIPIGFSLIDHGRRFIKHIRIEELIAESSGTRRSDAERSQAELEKKIDGG